MGRSTPEAGRGHAVHLGVGHAVGLADCLKIKVDQHFGSLLDLGIVKYLLLEGLEDVLGIGAHEGHTVSIDGNFIFGSLVLSLRLINSKEDCGDVAKLAALFNEALVGNFLGGSVQPVGDDDKHRVAAACMIGLLDWNKQVFASTNQEKSIVPLKAESCLCCELGI